MATDSDISYTFSPANPDVRPGEFCRQNGERTINDPEKAFDFKETSFEDALVHPRRRKSGAKI